MKEHMNRKSARILLTWCRKKYGTSEFYDADSLKLTIDKSLEYKGQYCHYDNTITLNPRNHRSTLSWCNTVIHEYIHFTQDMDRYHTEYGNRYNSHPFEIKARFFANRDQLEARRFLLSKLSQDSKYKIEKK
jgi:hypothetical protein